MDNLDSDTFSLFSFSISYFDRFRVVGTPIQNDLRELCVHLTIMHYASFNVNEDALINLFIYVVLYSHVLPGGPFLISFFRA